MWPLLSTLGPRILIPGVFVGQRISGLTDPAVISQTIAFSFLFISFAVVLFSETPWLSLIPGIAALAYWTMIKDEKNLEVYRYADWGLTTPLMLLAILLANGASFIHILSTLGLDFIMIGSGYYGAIEKDETKKQTAFALGCLVFLPILYTLCQMKKARYAVYLTVSLWILYPILWYLDQEGFITKESSTVSYSILDVIAKVGLVNVLHL